MGQATTKKGDGIPRREPQRPFDTRELANFPFPDDRDPPYRPWWVEVEPKNDGRQRNGAS